ncbi:ImpA family type VI secretion system protein [Serratia sp. AKBS12]|uniref:type VI secretion system protein TssA n=1 Tax=Serratia sp. AKBS12 TaxID=2974597 RepID=UPI002165984F|nr:type VI secretion system ImpA family N-terminal domain-containing protein [Serratia sp. AKBS12]MCS3408358.1 type VI secretion system ImpA family N-terminal domain-containing protein [Serratia sp. AKBS12]
MSTIIFNHIDGVEYDPLYNEILLALSEYDNSADPLNNSENIATVNWSDIREKSERLLDVCQDLRVMMWHLRASLHTQGIIALYRGMCRIDGALAAGGTIYPQMPDEPAGSSHAAALGWLSTVSCLSELRKARLAPELPLSLEAVQASLAQEGESSISFSELVVVLENSAVHYQELDCPPLQPQLLFVVEALKRIEHYANQNSDGYQLDCRNLRALLTKTAEQLMVLYASETNLAEVEGADEIWPSQAGASRGEGKVRSRQDAILLLDKVIDYFKTYEPSHPAPIFIRRSQKMIGMEFEEIVEELMPDAMGALASFIGKSQG